MTAQTAAASGLEPVDPSINRQTYDGPVGSVRFN
jgi:hypothetical protein